MTCGLIAAPAGPIIAGGAGAVCSGMVERYYENERNGRPGYDGVFDPKAVAVDFAIGAALGWGASKIPGLGSAADDLVDDFGDDFADDLAGGADDLVDDGARGGGKAPECSFSAATLVVMADGTTKAISEVEVGDQVLATDPETGETAAREVVATIPHTDNLLTLDTSGGQIVTTEDHRYWNQTDAEWQESQNLDQGDQLLTLDGSLVTVRGLDWTTVHTDEAYDLTIADFHTFYVSVVTGAVLVHNACFNFQGEASAFADDELAQFAYQHAGGGDVAGRPTLDQITRAMRNGRSTRIRDDAVEFVLGEVKVIINESTPWRSTAYLR